MTETKAEERRQKECLDKLTWATKELAAAAAAYAAWQYGGKGARPYECKWCRNWHLTGVIK